MAIVLVAVLISCAITRSTCGKSGDTNGGGNGGGNGDGNCGDNDEKPSIPTDASIFTFYNGEITGVSAQGRLLSEIVIPSEIDGEPVTSIGEHSFNSCTNLIKITIPDSVISIGREDDLGMEGAFRDCTNLTNVIFGKNSKLENLGSSTFANCKSLKSITIPNGVTSIKDDVFSYCKSLESVEIPSSVTSIGRRAFYSCRSLKNITIPDNVINIGREAFKDTKIYNDAPDNSIVYINKWVVGYKGVATDTVIKNGTVDIADYVFYGYDDLSSVTIPNSVINIGAGAFYYNTNLTSVTFDGNSKLESIGNDAFSQCAKLTKIEIPDSVTSIGVIAFNYSHKLASVTFGEDSKLTIMGDYAFSSCASLESIEIPSSVTSIRSNVFLDCKGLTEINVSELNANNITIIDSGVFSNCTSLESIVIPISVIAIENSVFHRCDNLTEIYFVGSEFDWDKIYKYDNPISESATIYFYSPLSPQDAGDFWHYDTGLVTPIKW